MRNKYFSLGIILTLLLLMGAVSRGLAKTEPEPLTPENRMEQKKSADGSLKPNTTDDKLRTRIRDETMEKRNAAKPGIANPNSAPAMKDASRKEATNVKGEMMTETKEALDARKTIMEKERMERMEKLEKHALEAKEKAETHRKEFETKAAAIHDARKKETAVRLADHFNKLNQNRIEHSENVLEKLRNILTRIGERTDRFEKKGTNVADVHAAIKKAEEAIAAAQTKTEEQAKKVYEVKFTTEDKLKAAFTAVQEAFKKDIVALRDAVQTAREAVHDTAVAYGKAHGEDTKKLEPSGAPAPTPVPNPAPTQ